MLHKNLLVSVNRLASTMAKVLLSFLPSFLHHSFACIPTHTKVCIFALRHVKLRHCFKKHGHAHVWVVCRGAVATVEQVVGAQALETLAVAFNDTIDAVVLARCLHPLGKARPLQFGDGQLVSCVVTIGVSECL